MATNLFLIKLLKSPLLYRMLLNWSSHFKWVWVSFEQKLWCCVYDCVHWRMMTFCGSYFSPMAIMVKLSLQQIEIYCFFFLTQLRESKEKWNGKKKKPFVNLKSNSIFLIFENWFFRFKWHFWYVSWFY